MTESALLGISPQVVEASLSPRDKYSEALDRYLEETMEIFSDQFSDLSQQGFIPMVNVDFRRGDELIREQHPLLRIPGRLEPGESVYLTLEGELYAVQQSQLPGAIDGEQARALRAYEVIMLASSVLRCIDLQRQKPPLR